MYEGRIVKEGGPSSSPSSRRRATAGSRTRSRRHGRLIRWPRRRRQPRAIPGLEAEEIALALSVEEIRAEFPILTREVHGEPLAYLDNGATRAEAARGDRRARRYWRRYNANVHRGVHTLSEEATAAYEGARETVADHIGADHREVIFVRNATEAINLVAYSWGRANVGEGDRIVLTEMEHHSNIVPWHLLAERGRRRARLGPDHRRGAPRRRGVRPPARARAEAGRRHPRLERARDDQPGRRARADGPRRRRARPRRRRPGGAEAAARRRRARRRLLRVHRAQGVRADRDRRALRAPRAARGDAAVHRRRLDDPQGRPRRDHAGPTSRRSSRRGTPAIAEAIGLGVAIDGSTASASTRSTPTSSSSPTTRSSGSPRSPACASSARPPATTAAASSRSRSTASTPTTSPRSSTATGSRSAPGTTARRC